MPASNVTPIPARRAPVDTAYINTLRSMEMAGGCVGALAEFIDNSIAADATDINILFQHNAVVITDNGKGVGDMSEIFTLGRGSNRKDTSVDNLGHFGQGGTSSALWLGYRVTCHTIHNGVGKSHSIDWRKVIDNDEWPADYRGREFDPKVEAPVGISGNQGTVILVEDRHHDISGRSFRGDSMAFKLARMYAPALQNGVNIKLMDYAKNNTASPRKSYVLSELLEDVLPAQRKSVDLVVSDKPLVLQYGEISHDEMKTVHSGLHICMGPRVVDTIHALGRHALPSEFWGKIELGSGWKSSLSRNKTELQAGRDELHAAVYEECKDLIEKLKTARKRVRIDLINKEFALALSGTIHNPKPRPRPDIVHRRIFWEPVSWRAKPKPKNSARGIALDMVAMGEGVAHKVIVAEDNVLIELNSDIPILDQAYSNPPNSSFLWSVIVMVMTSSLDACKKIFSNDEQFVDLLEQGDDGKAINLLQHHLLMAAPRVSEPTTKEINDACSE